MPDDIYRSRYTAEEIETALTIIRSIASRTGIPAGTGKGSVQILQFDDSSLTNTSGRVPSSAAVRRAIDAASSVTRILTYKGSVESPAGLPDAPERGDVYQADSDKRCYAWSGTQWVDAGELFIAGPPGRAFTYDDFTPEQLEALRGPMGETPSIVTDETTYQVGSSGTVPPEGEWSIQIPPVPGGGYLWSRRRQVWDTGSESTTYDVSYFGADGAGTVSAVCGKEPDADGNVALTAADVGAVPVSGGQMTGNLSVPAPVEALHAANKEYVDTRRLTLAVTLTASGWASNLQTVPVPEVTADATKTDVIASPDPEDDNYTAYQECGVWLYDQLDGAVQFKCTDVPAADLTVNILVRR